MHNAIELIPSSTTKDTFFSSAPFVDNSLVKNARITNGLYLPEKDQDSRSPTYDDEDFDIFVMYLKVWGYHKLMMITWRSLGCPNTMT